MSSVAAGGEAVVVVDSRSLVAAMVPVGLLLLGSAGPSSWTFCLAVCWSVGLLVAGSAVAAAPLLQPKKGPPRVGLCCRPGCWPLVVLGEGRHSPAVCCHESQR